MRICNEASVLLIIQRRLKYLCSSNKLQVSSKICILKAFSIDHSAVCCLFTNSIKITKGDNFWKFDSSLIINAAFNEQLKSFIRKAEPDVFDLF